MQERLEARRGTQSVQLRINLGEDNGIGTIYVGFLEPINRLIIFSQSHIDDRDIKWGNILLLGLLHQLSQNFLSLGPVARSAIGMPESSEHLRTVVRDADGLLKFCEGFWISVLLLVRLAENHARQGEVGVHLKGILQ